MLEDTNCWKEQNRPVKGKPRAWGWCLRPCFEVVPPASGQGQEHGWQGSAGPRAACCGMWRKGHAGASESSWVFNGEAANLGLVPELLRNLELSLLETVKERPLCSP